MRSIFLRKVSKNAAAVPLRRRRARAAAYVLFMCAPGGVFSRRQVFWYLWIFAHRPVCHSGGLREESKTKKRIARAYGFGVRHRFVRATLGPGGCRGPNCKESIAFPRRAGDGAKDKSRLLLHRRGLRRYYFHSSNLEPGEKLRAWCSSVFRENNFPGVMKYKTSSYLKVWPSPNISEFNSEGNFV